jgi:hypothetical protein
MLTSPTLEPNKNYTLTIEKLTVPAMDSIILNDILFTVERRLVTGVALGANTALPLAAEFTTFTPQSVRTVSQLVYQMNTMLREMCQRLATVVIAQTVPALHQFVIPATFTHQGGDWFTGLVNPIGAPGIVDAIKTALQVVFRPDGKLGFRFSVDGLKMFVVRLTDEGQRVFGRTQRYIALDAQGLFITDYEAAAVIPNLPTAAMNLPAVLTESYIFVCDNSMFSHISYRNELVLQASLPLDNRVEIDTDRSYYRRQLASYNFPSHQTKMEYTAVRHRELVETTQTQYEFEESLSTHNKFKVSGTDLQNFHLYLVNRHYEYDGSRYQVKETPYALHQDTFYTVQFALRPVK